MVAQLMRIMFWLSLLTDYGKTDGKVDITRISLELMLTIENSGSRLLTPMLSDSAGCSGKYMSKAARVLSSQCAVKVVVGIGDNHNLIA